MNFNVSHVRLTFEMRNYLNKIEELDKIFCNYRKIDFDSLYGNLSVTGYLEDVLAREIVRLKALFEFYGINVDNQLVGSLDPEAEEKTSESE